MEDDHQEQSGLLSEEFDDEQDFDQRRHSPPLSENETWSVKAFPYKQVGVVVFANSMVVAASQVIPPFLSEYFLY
jgi:hypothetical protein